MMNWRVTALRRLRGILKRPPGGKSLTEEMAEYKRAEKVLEERNRFSVNSPAPTA